MPLSVWRFIEKVLFWCAFLGVPVAILALAWLALSPFWEDMPTKVAWWLAGFGAVSFTLCLVFPLSVREELEEDERIRSMHE